MKILTVLMLLVTPLAARADVTVFACEPEWAALATELGGELVNAYSATSALQDPHYIQARPSLIAKVRRADLVICSGADLEIGWLPALLLKANNPRVRPGSRGYVEASSYVARLNASGDIDRSSGDIHPQGNPHIQTNPHNVAAVAAELRLRMTVIDSENAATYESNYANFSRRWTLAIAGWEEKAQPLRGRRVITHHKSWVYLQRWLGLEEAATLEPLAGLPPTAAHLSKLTREFARGGADVIIRSQYQDDKASSTLR